MGTSCRKISIKLSTLLDKKPEAENSRGEVTLLIAINISTCSRERERAVRHRHTHKETGEKEKWTDRNIVEVPT